MQNKDFYLSAQELAMDHDFIQWVKQPTKELNDFWHNWQSSNKQREKIVYEARILVAAIKFKEDARIDARIPIIKNNIYNKIRPKSTPNIVYRTYYQYFSLAAVITGFILLATFVFYAINHQSTIYSTGNGEVGSYVLPDSSVLILNANSSAMFKESEFKNGNRNLTLTGEGFFSVTHTKNNSKFYVHINDARVEVLGTEFSVFNRRGKVHVVLQSGKVTFTESVKQPELKEHVMEPGDMLMFTEKEAAMQLKKVIPETYSTWINNRLVFDNTEISEVIATLEDNYGYQVQLHTKKLQDEKFSGSAPVDNVQELLLALEIAFEVKITKKNNMLMITE